MVASSCAASSRSAATRHRSPARIRGTSFDNRSRSISQSGCGYEPTREVGRSMRNYDYDNVIPDCREAASPESIIPALVDMDSGLATSWRPGMTGEKLIRGLLLGGKNIPGL